MAERKWVKLKGSDFRLDYAQKRVDHADGLHFYFEDEKSQPARKIKKDVVDEFWADLRKKTGK